jgi:hypothetical protein
MLTPFVLLAAALNIAQEPHQTVVLQNFKARLLLLIRQPTERLS